jgi:hypothetical protein
MSPICYPRDMPNFMLRVTLREVLKHLAPPLILRAIRKSMWPRGEMAKKTERFEMRADPSFFKTIDDWRRKQADLPSRAEAIRRLVELGLRAQPR